MYRLSEKERHNREICKYLNNGNRYALVVDGEIIKAVRYSYQLDIVSRKYPKGEVINIRDLLIS